MKITYITNARIPTEKAHGYQICKMCEQFSDQGLEVELLVPTRRNNIKDNVFSYYSLNKNFLVKHIKSIDFIRYNKFFFGKSAYFQNLFFLINLLFKKPAKESLIYTRNPEIAWLFKKRGYQSFCEIHSWPNKDYLYKFFLKKIKIIVVTQALKDIFLENGFYDKNVLVEPDGVDLGVFDIDVSKEEARKKLDLPQDKKIIGYTGSFKTMEKDKGLKDIFQTLSKTKKDILFVAVGGSEKDIREYQKIADDLKVSNKVQLRKRVDLNKLAFYQKAFDVLLMNFPNEKHYIYYMSPLKMFEYMASKRPIIASDLPAIKEVLSDENAYFVRPSNKDDLIRAIDEAINDNKEKAKKAFLEVKKYSWGKRAKRIINFIKP